MHLRNHFEVWKATAKQRDDRVSALDSVTGPVLASVSVTALTSSPAKPAPNTVGVASSSDLHPHRLLSSSLLLKYTAPVLLLKYFNVWFKFANVSQWSRDLHLEHEHARLKAAWAAWKFACRRRRPRAPLSPDSAAAAGVKSLMPQVAARAPRSVRAAQPSDVAVNLDFMDSPHSVSPATDAQRPVTRRLVSPDDSARITFFFGGPCLFKLSLLIRHFLHC